MANSAILQAVALATAWSNHCGSDKKILDLSCGDGETARLLARLGYRVIATDYAPPPPMSFYKLYYLLFHYGFEIEK